MALPLPHATLQTLKGHTGAVHVGVYNRDGQYLVTGGADKTIRLWNPLSGMCIKQYTGHGWEILDIDVATDNSKFASAGGGDKAVFIWDVSTGNTIRRFYGHHQRVNAVVLNQESSIVISGSYDASVKIWDIRSNNRYPIQSMEDGKDSVSSLTCSDHEILVGCVDGNIRTYDLRMGSLITDRIGHAVTCVSYSNDGNCILASSLDNTIRLFDKENGELLASYTGHKNTDYKVASTLSNTDAHVISGSEDGNIYMWDLVDGHLVRELSAAHTRVVTSVAYHPKETMMCSTSVDGTVKVWS